jgi:hypothetical protein
MPFLWALSSFPSVSLLVIVPVLALNDEILSEIPSIHFNVHPLNVQDILSWKSSSLLGIAYSEREMRCVLIMCVCVCVCVIKMVVWVSNFEQMCLPNFESCLGQLSCNRSCRRRNGIFPWMLALINWKFRHIIKTHGNILNPRDFVKSFFHNSSDSILKTSLLLAPFCRLGNQSLRSHP